MGHNVRVGHTGKRAGPRRTQPTITPALLALCAGVTLCVVAWGYLVKAAIDFGTTARGGQSEAWGFLALASLGAIACLFVGLMLVSRITRRLGITNAPSVSAPAPRTGTGETTLADPAVARPVGGRRAAR